MLEDTGERIIPDLKKPNNGMLLEHIARYYFATPYANGRVLDFACGSGYGSHLVAKERKREVTEIFGIDNDIEAIQYAKERYGHQLTSYQVHDAFDPELPRKIGTFDTILSFETLEHVPDDHKFMEQIWRLLRPGGTLVLSTPFGKGRGEPCGSPFHYFQLTPEEFKALFTGYSDCEIYYQRGVTIEPPRKEADYYLGVAVCNK